MQFKSTNKVHIFRGLPAISMGWLSYRCQSELPERSKYMKNHPLPYALRYFRSVAVALSIVWLTENRCLSFPIDSWRLGARLLWIRNSNVTRCEPSFRLSFVSVTWQAVRPQVSIWFGRQHSELQTQHVRAGPAEHIWVAYGQPSPAQPCVVHTSQAACWQGSSCEASEEAGWPPPPHVLRTAITLCWHVTK